MNHRLTGSLLVGMALRDPQQSDITTASVSAGSFSLSYPSLI